METTSSCPNSRWLYVCMWSWIPLFRVYEDTEGTQGRNKSNRKAEIRRWTKSSWTQVVVKDCNWSLQHVRFDDLPCDIQFRLHPRVIDHYNERPEFQFIAASLPVYLTHRSGIDQQTLRLLQQGSFNASKVAEVTRYMSSLKHDLTNVVFMSAQLLRARRYDSSQEAPFEVKSLRQNHLIMSDTFLRDIQLNFSSCTQKYKDQWLLLFSFQPHKLFQGRADRKSVV